MTATELTRHIEKSVGKLFVSEPEIVFIPVIDTHQCLSLSPLLFKPLRIRTNPEGFEFLYTISSYISKKSFCAYAGKDCLFKKDRNQVIIKVFKQEIKQQKKI